MVKEIRMKNEFTDPTTTLEDGSNIIAYAYFALQVINTVSFYLSTVTPLELAEVASCGAVTGYAKAQARKEKNHILDPKMLDTIFEQTLMQNKELQPLVDKAREHFLEVYKSHQKKLEKGIGELAKEGSLEDSFLAMHKLNFAAIDRYFTNELLKNNQNHNIKDILKLKNSLTAGIMTSAATIKEGSMLIGEGIGALMHKMKSYLSKEDNETLDFMVKEFSKTTKGLSPFAYMAYQIYKTTSKLGRAGMQAALLPIDATVVAASGFLEGASQVVRNDKKSDLHVAYDNMQKQSWYDTSKTVLFATTGLCSDILRDWRASYNFATDKREKFIKAMSGGIEKGVELKPHKAGSELLFYSIVAEQGSTQESSWLKTPVIKIGTGITATFRATLGTSAKYTFKAAQQAGQFAGEIIKFTNQGIGTHL